METIVDNKKAVIYHVGFRYKGFSVNLHEHAGAPDESYSCTGYSEVNGVPEIVETGQHRNPFAPMAAVKHQIDKRVKAHEHQRST